MYCNLLGFMPAPGLDSGSHNSTFFDDRHVAAAGLLHAADSLSSQRDNPELDARGAGPGSDTGAGSLVRASLRRAPLVPRQGSHPGR